MSEYVTLSQRHDMREAASPAGIAFDIEVALLRLQESAEQVGIPNWLTVEIDLAVNLIEDMTFSGVRRISPGFRDLTVSVQVEKEEKHDESYVD